MSEYYDQRMHDFDRAQRAYENQEPQEICICQWFTEDGVCTLHSGFGTTEYCVEGPCPDYEDETP